MHELNYRVCLQLRACLAELLESNESRIRCPAANEALLKAALVRRAMTDVSRVVRLREDKPAVQNLLQKGLEQSFAGGKRAGSRNFGGRR